MMISVLTTVRWFLTSEERRKMMRVTRILSKGQDQVMSLLIIKEPIQLAFLSSMTTQFSFPNNK